MLSDNLAVLRKQLKLSQEQVAERIGVSRQAVAKWESGETVPDIINCSALAKLYDVTIDELINYQSAENLGVPIAPNGKYMFGMVTVGERGQIVIPAKARKIFRIEPGDSLIILGEAERGLALVNAKDFMNDISILNNEMKKTRKDSKK